MDCIRPEAGPLGNDYQFGGGASSGPGGGASSGTGATGSAIDGCGSAGACGSAGGAGSSGRAWGSAGAGGGAGSAGFGGAPPADRFFGGATGEDCLQSLSQTS